MIGALGAPYRCIRAGETDEELAESFLQQMLDGGHARRV